MRRILKKIGRILITLTQEEDKVLKRSVLIVDNGYSSYEHLHSTVVETQRRIVDSDVSVLTFEHRRRFLQENFPDIELIHPNRQIRLKRYALSIQMFKLRKRGYDFVILMSLDITPIIVSILFMNSKVLLYNQWHQWWSLRPKSIEGYLIAVPKFIFKLIFNIIIFIYLLISVSWIFLKSLFNFFR
jgi:hypothetical protein